MTHSTHLPDRVRSHLQTEYRSLLDGVESCADTVVDTWDEDGVSDRRAVTEPFERFLRDADILDVLPTVLDSTVSQLGYELAAPPVAAPPYVVVTSRGLVLRATIPPGRLVVEIECFGLTRGERLTYDRLDDRRLGVQLR
ncbi:hypothetical protein [Halovivax gelatinilyticus]|uniref:hypothetical protein n=1 Tax=Halovivax gelatinilyticus TaxID=2961597 RepID=UPI0020CA83CA|nr:hypothetical protein [Halovivax gelatinilyticus]